MSNCKVESCTVESSDGVKLHTRVFKPLKEEEEDNNKKIVIVLVHPYSVLGGCQGLLKGIASGLAGNGYKAVTFDMRGVGRSTGRSSLTGFAEVKDVISICNWVSQNLSANRILLVGSSAGTFLFPSLTKSMLFFLGYYFLDLSSAGGTGFSFLFSVVVCNHAFSVHIISSGLSVSVSACL